MINLEIPYTYENSENPWLMDKKDNTDVIEINGIKYTANYLWTLNKDERIKALNNVYNYYRDKGFPYLNLSDDIIVKEFNKLKLYDVNNIIKENKVISNSCNLCIDLCKYFCKDYFYKASGGGNTLSVEDVFFNDEYFIKVLKNRMGWNTSKEDGKERPYIFPISDKQILNGIRNSGLGYGVSNFRPVIAKWMYKHAKELLNYNINKPYIFDYSAGWGARLMGALSLGYNYYSTDPLTYNCINDIFNKLNTYLKKDLLYEEIDFKSYNNGSQDLFFKNDEFKNKFDIIGSCPPYFDLEIYSDNKTQSNIEYNNYDLWLSEYWNKSVDNFKYMLKDNGIFILVMKETLNKHNILDDMNNILFKYGFNIIEDWVYKTSTNHLSGKTKTGRTSKYNEHIIFYLNKI